MAWRGQAGHYEVWFLTLTDRQNKTGYWIRYTLESPEPGHGPPYAELWFCRSDGNDPGANFGFHRRFDISQLSCQHRPFVLRVGPGELGHGHATGSLSGDGHDVSWDLCWEGLQTTHRLLPSVIYSNPLGLAETVLLSPNHSIFVSGTIVIDGQRISLQKVPGGQSHLWGKKHAYGWAWARCNAFDQHGDGPQPAVLEALTVRMRRGPLVVPLSVLSLYPEGLKASEIAFRHFTNMPLISADYRTGQYVISARGLCHAVDAQFQCSAADMVRTEYVDPDGSPAYNHYAGTASCTVHLKSRPHPLRPFEVVRTWHSDRGAQFEWAGRAGDSQVQTQHVLVS